MLQETPRAAADQEQEVVGLFLNYDAGASFTDQEPAPLNEHSHRLRPLLHQRTSRLAFEHLNLF